MKQLTLIETESITKESAERNKQKAKWQNAFQRWSDEAMDGTTGCGVCGFGSMCDYCEDNSYGRPCVRALNAMCHEKGIEIDYTNYDFKEVWHGRYS